MNNITNDFIAKCTYDNVRDSLCPVFTIQQILNEAEPNPKEQAQMLLKGGVIQIGIDWDCNYDLSNPCSLKYIFNRFDLPFNESSAASGFNFRFKNIYLN